MSETTTMELTNEERRVIEAARAKKAAKTAANNYAMLVLEVADDYLKWLTENGAGDTYSTFCDDFGYEAPDCIDRSTLHFDIMTLIELARKKGTEIYL